MDFSHVGANLSSAVEGPKTQWGNKDFKDVSQPSWRPGKNKGGEVFSSGTPQIGKFKTKDIYANVGAKVFRASDAVESRVVWNTIAPKPHIGIAEKKHKPG